jgi:hypothetical protein
MTLLKTCKKKKKGWRMNAMENFYMQKHQYDGTLMQEQILNEENPLLRIIISTHLNTHEQNRTLQTQPQTGHSVITTTRH